MTQVDLPGHARPGAVHDLESAPIRQWSRYQLVELIGTGGTGRVFKAFDPRLRRFVALKFLDLESREAGRRFLAEGEAQAVIDHENVCKIYEAGEADGRPYIAMQLVIGASLKELHHRMTITEKVRLAADVARGLDAAHQLGVIHRDVKPANIMVEGDAHSGYRPVLVDFGIARQYSAPETTATGLVLGTPAFVAPEQASCDAPAGPRSDIFSLGVTLYEILSGRPAFDGGSAIKILMKIVHEEPEPLSQVNPAIPTALETVVMKCLEKDPDRRYASAAELALDLERFLAGKPVQAEPVTAAQRVIRRARRLPAPTTLAAAGVLSLVLGGLWLDARTERERAIHEASQATRRAETACDAWRDLAASAPHHGVPPIEACSL